MNKILLLAVSLTVLFFEGEGRPQAVDPAFDDKKSPVYIPGGDLKEIAGSMATTTNYDKSAFSFFVKETIAKALNHEVNGLIDLIDNLKADEIKGSFYLDLLTAMKNLNRKDIKLINEPMINKLRTLTIDSSTSRSWNMIEEHMIEEKVTQSDLMEIVIHKLKLESPEVHSLILQKVAIMFNVVVRKNLVTSYGNRNNPYLTTTELVEADKVKYFLRLVRAMKKHGLTGDLAHEEVESIIAKATKQYAHLNASSPGLVLIVMGVVMTGIGAIVHFWPSLILF